MLRNANINVKDLREMCFFLKIVNITIFFSSFLFRDRIDPFAFKFQFKNVEYSSGRNKTFLCFLVDCGSVDGIMRGYLEDEHSGPHAEEAFFLQILPDYDPACKYTVTWYIAKLTLSHGMSLKEYAQ